MKKFLGISIETNIGILVLAVVASIFTFYNKWAIPFLGLIPLVYLWMIYYFKFVFPYRPFEIMLSFDGFREGEIITTGRNKKVKIIEKKKRAYGHTIYKVKPIKAKTTIPTRG